MVAYTEMMPIGVPMDAVSVVARRGSKFLNGKFSEVVGVTFPATRTSVACPRLPFSDRRSVDQPMTGQTKSEDTTTTGNDKSSSGLRTSCNKDDPFGWAPKQLPTTSISDTLQPTSVS